MDRHALVPGLACRLMNTSDGPVTRDAVTVVVDRSLGGQVLCRFQTGYFTPAR